MNFLINKILRESIHELLNEYSSEPHLPFAEDEFKNKNYLEQYTDWLEDFGKYGTLPSTKLNFWEEIQKAIKYIVDNGLHQKGHYSIEISDVNEIYKTLKDEIFANYLNSNRDGNVYVERAVSVPRNANSYDTSDKNGQDPTKLYNALVKNYQNNVGGCWSYKEGGAYSYCGDSSGNTLVMRGYVRNEDIDFVKTVLLNFHYSNEHEIRVKPNAKIELVEVTFGEHEIPLKGHLIVNATYFGNNGKYKGEYASVDDGFGNHDYMDRKGNIINNTEFIKKIQERLNQGADPKDVFDWVGKFVNGFARVELTDKWSFIDTNRKLIGDGNLWFDYVSNFENGFANVISNNKYSYINTDGKLIGDGKLWFDSVEEFKNGFAVVELKNKWSFINTDGNLIGNGKLWFDDVNNFVNGFTRVKLDDKYSFINTDGNLIGDGKLWFDSAEDFNNGFAQVELNGDWSFINTDGNLIGNGKLWFDGAEDFENGFVLVYLNDKCSFIDTNGKLIGDGKLWFDSAEDFNNGFAQVELNGKWSFINTDGNLIGNGNVWFDGVDNFRDGFAQVNLDDKYSFIDTNGKLIGDGKLWFDWVFDFNYGLAQVKLNDKWYYMDTNLNFYDGETKQLIPNPFKNTNESKHYLKKIIREELFKLI